MKILLWPLLALALYAIQTSWFHFFTTTQSPDLLLIFVLLMALEEGASWGGMAGLAIGALQDVVTFTFFGYHIITRALLGFVLGAVRGNVFKDQLSTFLVLIALASSAVKLMHLVFLIIYQGEFLPLWPFMLDLSKYVSWNVLCAIPMWLIAKVGEEIMRRRARRYYSL